MTTIKAIEGRVRRKLNHEGQALRKSRSQAALLDLGEFYIIDVKRNFILAKNIDLMKLAKELKVLKPGEKVA